MSTIIFLTLHNYLLLIMNQDAIPWITEKWTPQSAGIKAVSFDRDSVEEFKQLQHEWHGAGSSAGRFTKALRDKYEVVPVIRV